MTLAELITEVYTITNRPDMVAKTLSAIQSATLKAHHSDFYHKDLYEALVDFSTASYEPDFEYRTFIPRWRSGKYFRKYDPTNAVPGVFLERIAPENALDEYSTAQKDVWYGGGEIIHLKSSTEERYFLMGCYVHPVITEVGYTSWIAEEHPWAIIYAAAQTIFRTVGKTEEARGMKEEVGEQMILLRNSNILETGE